MTTEPPKVDRRYTYGQLSPGNIRLLCLLPASDSDHLQCELKPVSVSKPPPYEAISYTWGAPLTESSDSISCGVATIGITSNLATCLQQLRHTNDRRTLWADQICIDQGNSTERSQQVNLMGQIFKEAERVIMWLGPDDAGARKAPLAAALLERIAPLQRQERLRHDFLSEDLLASHDLPHMEALEWKAVDNLFSLPYFERAWIYQEVTLAASRHILWGSTQLNFSHVKEALAFLRQHQLLFRQLPALHLDNFQAAFQMLDTARSSDLYHLLCNSAMFKATDERDRVFSLLGLLDEVPEFLQADYTRTLAEVSLAAAVYVAHNTRRLDFLTYRSVSAEANNTARSDDDDEYWPSWVPKWNGQRLPTLRSLNARLDHDDRHRWWYPPKDHLVSGRFGASGLRIAAVRFTGPKFPNEDIKTLKPDPIASAWQLCRQHCDPQRPWSELLKQLILCYTACDPRLPEPPDRPQHDYFTGFAVYVAMYYCPTATQSRSLDPASLSANLHLAYLAAILSHSEYITTLKITHSDPSALVEEWRTNRLAHLRQHTSAEYTNLRATLQRDISRSVPDEAAAQEALDWLIPLYTLAPSEVSRFLGAYVATAERRRFFITDGRELGIGSNGLEEGDVVVWLFGCSVPLLLRECGDGWELVGECWVEGTVEDWFVDELVTDEEDFYLL